jgi:hypothetical protein
LLPARSIPRKFILLLQSLPAVERIMCLEHGNLWGGFHTPCKAYFLPLVALFFEVTRRNLVSTHSCFKE